MISSALLDLCRERFAAESAIVAVWVFGSAVSGRLREDSDVDFAVFYAPDAARDIADRARLVGDLEAILQRSVDLGRLSSRNLVYAVQATQRGKLLYARDPQEALAFVSRMYSLYLDLKYDRKVVEDAYCA